jgi:hypothetical protein
MGFFSELEELKKIVDATDQPWLNMMLARYQPPPETPWVWYPFPDKPPTFAGRYLVFIPHKWNNTFETQYAWYMEPPATPWLTHPHVPHHKGCMSVNCVSHWMVLPLPEAYHERVS